MAMNTKKEIKEKKTLLITGGAGFIGCHTVKHFVEKYPEWDIICVDALTYAGNIENLKDVIGKDNFTFVELDIRDANFINALFKEHHIDYVIHLAAESHVDRSMVNPTLFAETNIMGTLNLLNAAKTNWGTFPESLDTHIFINMGTDEIFGALEETDFPFDEDTPFNPHSPYSASKTAAVQFGLTYRTAYKLPIINVACGNAIGPNQFPEKLVPLTIDRLVNKKEIPIYGAGLQIRDWTYVGDIVNCFDTILDKWVKVFRVVPLICIGGDNEKRNIQMVHALIKEYANQTGEDEKELKKLIMYIGDPRGDSHDFRYAIDHSFITRISGWKPQKTFDEIVHETVKWYLENQDWVDRVKSGEYKQWMEDFYGFNREQK